MNGIPLLDAIPVNWFILGVSILAGVILFLILTQIPDDDDEKASDDMKDQDMSPTPMALEDNMEDDDEFVAEEVKPKKAPKKKKTSRK